MEKSTATTEGRFAYGVEELRKATGLSEGFFRNEIAAGRLPVRRAGRRVLILASDWQRYVETFWPSGAK